MFTGLIEDVGTIRAVRHGGGWSVLDIETSLSRNGLSLGDSVAVNGVCLTASGLLEGGFSADVMPQTMRMSNLGTLREGSKVNLERAMPCDGRFGGHFVSGHVDGRGVATSLRKEGNALLLRVSASPEILKYIVPKGSVALDGVSLTVAEVTGSDFMVSLIPHTLGHTVLEWTKVGDSLNIENDIIGKYVEKLLGTSGRGGLTEDFLKENGF